MCLKIYYVTSLQDTKLSVVKCLLLSVMVVVVAVYIKRIILLRTLLVK